MLRSECESVRLHRLRGPDPPAGLSRTGEDPHQLPPPDSDCGDHPFTAAWLFCPGLGVTHTSGLVENERVSSLHGLELSPGKSKNEKECPARWWQNFLPSETLWQGHRVLTVVLIGMSPVTTDAEWLLLARFPPLCPLSWKVCTNLRLLYKQLFLFVLLSFEGSYYILDTAIGWVHDVLLFYPCLWRVFHSLDSHVGTKKFLNVM